MDAGTTLTKQEFIARLEQLRTGGELVELVQYSRRHFEEVLGDCSEVEAERINDLMRYAHRLAPEAASAEQQDAA